MGTYSFDDRDNFSQRVTPLWRELYKHIFTYQIVEIRPKNRDKKAQKDKSGDVELVFSNGTVVPIEEKSREYGKNYFLYKKYKSVFIETIGNINYPNDLGSSIHSCRAHFLMYGFISEDEKSILDYWVVDPRKLSENIKQHNYRVERPYTPPENGTPGHFTEGVLVPVSVLNELSIRSCTPSVELTKNYTETSGKIKSLFDIAKEET
jgi:hypothetical protein